MGMGRHSTVEERVTLEDRDVSFYHWSPQCPSCQCCSTGFNIQEFRVVLPEHFAMNLRKSLNMKSCSHSRSWESCHGIQSFNKEKCKMSPVWHQRGSSLGQDYLLLWQLVDLYSIWNKNKSYIIEWEKGFKALIIGKEKKMFTFAKTTGTHLTSSPQTMSQKRETGVQIPANQEARLVADRADWFNVARRSKQKL